MMAEGPVMTFGTRGCGEITVRETGYKSAKKGSSGEEQSLEQSGLVGREDRLQACRSVESEVFFGGSQKHLEEGICERTRPPTLRRDYD